MQNNLRIKDGTEADLPLRIIKVLSVFQAEVDFATGKRQKIKMSSCPQQGKKALLF